MGNRAKNRSQLLYLLRVTVSSDCQSVKKKVKVQIKYVFNSIFSSEEAGICTTAATVRGILDWVFTQTLSRVLKAGKMATKYILSDK